MNKHAKKKSKTKITELNIEEAINIEKHLKSIAAGDIINASDEKVFQMAAQLISTLTSIYGMWSNSKKKINKLLKMVFGNSSEKLKDLGEVSGSAADDNKNHASGNTENIDSSDENVAPVDTDKENKRVGGGGKNSAEDYESAAEISCEIDHDKMPGKICPKCGKNKLYEIEPKKVIRLVGNAPITAFKFILQQVRCICGAIYCADVGDDFRDIYNEDKYGPSALASMMIYKYLMGVSFGNLSSIQEMSGVPLPASTQANKIKSEGLPVVQAVVKELEKLAANANAIGFDDTVIKTIKERSSKSGSKTHRGHGTAVIANDFDINEHEIVLFNFNPSKHAGDVVCDLLLMRERDQLPLLISDGLNSYDKCKKEGIDINCNTHARRKVVTEDPDRKSYVGQAVLDCYSKIYKNDKNCKDKSLSLVERMNYHNEHSFFYFEKIKAIFNIIVDEVDTPQIRDEYSIPSFLTADEPSGDVANIANYFLTRYKSLTQVMYIAGVPLDTNYVERMIKVAIRIRKNSLFFNNASSAEYSGEILSLLETAVQNDINVFDYMKFLLANKKDALINPKNYIPWLFKSEKKEITSYWNGVDEFIKAPSNSFEFSVDESCHSLA